VRSPPGSGVSEIRNGIADALLQQDPSAAEEATMPFDPIAGLR